VIWVLGPSRYVAASRVGKSFALIECLAILWAVIEPADELVEQGLFVGGEFSSKFEVLTVGDGELRIPSRAIGVRMGPRGLELDG